MYVFEFEGHKAYIISPENPNGEWIWKTEFFEAFDQAERKLLDEGYTRVYYCISDKYGSDEAIRSMHRFHLHVVKKLNLKKRCILFGFSRGGIYAYNYCLYYPEYVKKIYLDAPVLDLKSWPVLGSFEQKQFFKEYNLNQESYESFSSSPKDSFREFFSANIPVLLIAGCKDELVPFEKNAKEMIKYCNQHNIDLKYILKENCGHHPHSLMNVQPIVDFVKGK